MTFIETNRLAIRYITVEDSPFIFRLLNEPTWIKYIGDKGIKTEYDAKNYIQTGPLQMYKEFGFGLYLVTLKETAVPIGLCGLIKRPSLENIDLGYAFFPEYTGMGYAFEAAKAVIQYGKEKLSIDKIVAITTIDNLNSEEVLLKLGFSFDSLIKEDNTSEELKLFTKGFLIGNVTGFASKHVLTISSRWLILFSTIQKQTYYFPSNRHLNTSEYVV